MARSRTKYVDGFVLPVKKAKLDTYKKVARLAGKVFIEHGALAYHEAVGDDLKVPCGMAFPTLVEPKRGETVVFAWIEHKSKAARDRTNKKVMEDPRMQMEKLEIVFDMERMAWGGFEVMVGVSGE